MNEGDQDEVERLKRIIDALMDRAERSGIIQGADIDLFRTAVLLEEELERRKEELAEALAENEKIKNRFRRILEHAPIGIGIADASGTFIEVNDALCALSGREKAELHGMQTFDILHPDDRETARRILEKLRHGNESVIRSEVRFQGGEQMPVLVNLSIVPEPDSSGMPLHFICMTEGISGGIGNEDPAGNQASYDGLTELPNRALFFDRLSREFSKAKRAGRRVALICLDLDGFKPINDRYGHDAEDSVLRMVVKRWLTSIRSTDTLARMGGNEFAVIAGDLETGEEAIPLARKLIGMLIPPLIMPNGMQIRIGASAGIAIHPDNAADMDSLLFAADRAMHESKSRGRNVCTLSGAKPSPLGSGEECLCFNESLLVGARELDEQHRHLVRMINHLNEILSSGHPDVGHSLSELFAYLTFHFETEHRLMAQHGYPDMTEHDLKHERMTREIGLLSGEPGDELLVLQKLRNWHLDHSRNFDSPLGEYLAKKGIL